MIRYAYSLFCDDIRHEVNGKVSFMGTFAGALFLPGVPAVLPKLCCVISVHADLENPMKSLKVTGTFVGQTIFAIDMGEEELQGLYASAPQVEDRKGFMAQFMMLLSPFNIESFGKLEVEILADGERLECAGLQVGQAPDGMTLV